LLLASPTAHSYCNSINERQFIQRILTKMMAHTLLLILSVITTTIFQIHAQTEDYYCGTDFTQAQEACELPCSSGFDFECTKVLGDAYACYYFTGCSAKVSVQESVAAAESPTGKPSPSPTAVQTPAPTAAAVETESPTPALETDKPTAAPIQTESPTLLAITSSTEVATTTTSFILTESSTTSSVTSSTEVATTSTASIQTENTTITSSTQSASLTTTPVLTSFEPTTVVSSNTQDGFCGTDYFQAVEECQLPCPTGNNDECINALGQNYTCFLFTGCTEKQTPTGTTSPDDQVNSPSEPTAEPSPIPTGQAKAYVELILHNTANREMTIDEEDMLINELMKIFEFWCCSFSTEIIEVLNQEQVQWISDDQRRELQGDVGFEEIISTSATLLLYTSYQGEYSDDQIAKAAAELLEANGEELVKELQGQDEFPFFFSLDQIRSSPAIFPIEPSAPVASPKSEALESQTPEEPANQNGAGAGTCVFNVNTYYVNPCLMEIPYLVFGGIAGGAVLFCIAGIGLSYYLVRKCEDVKSERTLEVEDLEVGKSNHSTVVKNLAGHDGPMKDDSSSESGSSSSSENSSSRIISRGKASKRSKTQRKVESSSSSSSERGSKDKAFCDVENPFKDLPMHRTQSSGLLSSASSSDSSKADSALMKRVEERRAKRKHGDKRRKQQLSQSNPDITPEDMGEQQKLRSRHSTNDLVGLGKSNEEKLLKKAHWKTLSKSLDSEFVSAAKERARGNNAKLANISSASKQLESLTREEKRSGKDKTGLAKKRSSNPDVAAHEDSRNEVHKMRSRHSTNDLAGLDESPGIPQKSNHWKKLSKSLQAGDVKNLGSDRMDEGLPEMKRNKQWKTLAKSIQAGDIKRTVQDDGLPPNSNPSNDLNISESEYISYSEVEVAIPAVDDSHGKKDHWKSLKSSIKDDAETNDQRKPKARSRSKSKDNWAKVASEVVNSSSDLRKSDRGADPLRQSSRHATRRNTDELRQSRRLGDGDDLRKSTRGTKGSSDDLRRSKRSTNDFRQSRGTGERRNSDDLRQSKRASSDLQLSRVRSSGDLRKSDRGADPLRQSSRKASLRRNSDELRQSRRASDHGDERKLTRSRTYGSSDDLRRSKPSTGDLRQAKQR
jgi:hypothetical protein